MRRAVLPLIALLAVAGAASAETADTVAPPVAPLAQPGSAAVCRDRIHEVRRELGKPALNRDASAQGPVFIAAVDKRIGGCSVMVMRNDTSDIRPLPEPRDHRLMPARR